MGKKHFKRKTNNRSKEYYERRANKSKEKKIIKNVRISLIAIWCLITLFVLIKYNSYVRFAMIWHFSLGVFLLYFGTVGVYKAVTRDRSENKSKAGKKIDKSFLAVIYVAVVALSMYVLTTIMGDIILGDIETREVHVMDVKSSTKGGKSITLENGRTYSQSRGSVDIDSSGVYKVNILPHSKIIIPLEKK